MDILKWSAPEYEERNRSVDWYWGAGLVVLVVIGAAIYFENYLFAILVFVSTVSLALFSIKKPVDISYELNDHGAVVHSTLYPFQTLESFWVEQLTHPKIILQSKKFFVPYIIIPIHDYEPKLIRAFLLRHLPEVEHHEPFINHIVERLGL